MGGEGLKSQTGSAPTPALGAAAAPAPQQGAAAPPGLMAPPSPAREKLLADIRKRPFRPEDMVANPPTNTDPFHNNIDRFISAPPPPDKQLGSCVLPKYGLEELKLTAIILGASDGTAARAMFVDPTGVGTVVKRADRLSKTCALIQRILSDRVLFEFTEDLGQGKKRSVVRAVELHPVESQSQGSSGGAGLAPVPK